MSIGAVITAACMSNRMVQFKQYMKIGNRTMAERIVVNFKRAGINNIVMVTGYRSKQIEKELKNFDITFLENDKYEISEMFESVKIGLDYMKNRCDRILFCPVDIPFFMEKTVEILIKQDGDVVLPVYNGRSGHPILINASIVTDILCYQGKEGLKGAINSIQGIKRVRIAVDDEAIVMSPNITREDFKHLIDLHNSRLIHPETEVRLANYKSFLDKHTVELLEYINTIGSVREACAKAGISYSKGWTIIHDAEDGVGYRIVERQPGGKNGGMAVVTEKGKELIKLFVQYENQVKHAAEELFENVFKT